MAKVTSITNAKAELIRGAIFSGAQIDWETGHLILTRGDATTEDLGRVIFEPVPQVKMLENLYAFDSSGSHYELVPEWYNNGRANLKLPDPASLPAANASQVAWDPSGRFLAVGTGASPYIKIYSRSGDTLTLLSAPATLPSGVVSGLAWDSAGQYLHVATNASPYYLIYKRSGTTLTNLTGGVGPNVQPGSIGMAFGYGAYSSGLAVVGEFSSPYLTIYTIAGDNATRLTGGDGFTTAMTSAVQSIDLVQNELLNVYIAVGSSASPYLTIYKQNYAGAPSVKLPNPSVLPGNVVSGVAFSSRGNYLAVAQSATPVLMIYKRTVGTDTFIKLPDPEELPVNTQYAVTWSPDDRYLAVTGSSTPYIRVYKRDGDTFIKLPDFEALPTGTAADVKWSPDGAFLAIAHTNSPYLTVYKSDMGSIFGLGI